MKHVGIVEAEANLSALVEEVQKGGAVVITRDGKPVARLVPEQPELIAGKRARRREAIDQLRKLSKQINADVSYADTKASVNEGRP